jgi:hypothetical protein
MHLSSRGVLPETAIKNFAERKRTRTTNAVSRLGNSFGLADRAFAGGSESALKGV